MNVRIIAFLEDIIYDYDQHGESRITSPERRDFAQLCRIYDSLHTFQVIHEIIIRVSGRCEENSARSLHFELLCSWRNDFCCATAEKNAQLWPLENWNASNLRLFANECKTKAQTVGRSTSRKLKRGPLCRRARKMCTYLTFL